MECENCHREFSYPASHRPRKFCNRTCFQKYRTKMTIVESVCQYCSCVIKHPKSQVRKYCSSKCAHEGRKSQPKKSYEKKPKIQISCLWCHKNFDVTEESRDLRKFDCSDCSRKFEAIKNRVLKLSDGELEKLVKLGKDYRFRDPVLNSMYFNEPLPLGYGTNEYEVRENE